MVPRPHTVDTSQLTNLSTDSPGDTMSTTPDPRPRRRRWTRLVLIGAAVRGAFAGAARAAVDRLLDLL